MKSGTEKTEYFMGLTLEGEAVGYAAADEAYRLLKFRGEPVWGVHLFDAAESAEERRLFRGARRRLDRRQQRVRLVQEIFAKEIASVDPGFYARIRESALFPEDSEAGVHLFGNGRADSAYNKRYPTIHHLLCELMEDETPHDVRLVYLGCAWLVGHRGHFLPLEEGEAPIDLGGEWVSRWKVRVYEQHRADLKTLKRLVRAYAPEKYGEMFRAREKGLPNYAAYRTREGVSPGAFGKYVKSVLKAVVPATEDEAALADVLARAGEGTFMPRQVGEENRLLPNEVFAAELRQVLEKAAGYLPFLRERDGDGYTPEEKLLAIMGFRIPYYVGPLKDGWLVRKGAGPIRPWNFGDMVDEDASEEAFIRRMTGQCTYLPGEDVLPRASMVYQRFEVLNTLNTLRVGGERIDVEAKQRIFRELFEAGKKVTAKTIAAHLGVESVEGVDEGWKASLGTYGAFRNLLASGALTGEDVETIAARGTYSQDKGRFKRWLAGNYPRLTEEDIGYIAGLKFKDFGRLSRAFLEELVGAERATGEADTVLGWMWNRNVTLMELLSERFTFAEQIAQAARAYYDGRDMSLSERLEEMYVPGEGRRPIIRALDVARDVAKAMGQPPKRIFLESGRAGSEQAGQRTVSRYEQVRALYETCSAAPELGAELEAVDPEWLRSDRVFLYFLQLGRCMYTGERIELGALGSGRYNLDHIYPRSKVRDDSVWNNLILVRADVNRWKDNVFPIPEYIRAAMTPFWAELRQKGLITEEKFSRLIRDRGFSDEEAWGFIARQSGAARPSVRVLGKLLQEYWPETEIVYVNRGLVAEFRREFDMARATTVNDLYRAKDAYLNIAVGNVWHERFTRQWFFGPGRGDYTLRVGALYGHPVTVRGREIWAGVPSVEAVANTVRHKNAVHLTRYAYCRGGGLFDQQPVAAKAGLVERKAGLPTEKYGGYTGLTVSYFLLARYFKGTRYRLGLVPVRTIAADKVREDEAAAVEYVQGCLGPKARDVSLPLGLRPLKINTVFDLGGYRVCLRGVSGERVAVSPMAPLVIGYEWEAYVRRLERRGSDSRGLSPERNLALYDLLCAKMGTAFYRKRPGDAAAVLKAGRSRFEALDATGQALCLGHVLELFGRGIAGCDLSAIGGRSRSAVPTFSAALNSWPDDGGIRIVDLSPSGLFESRSRDLLDYLPEE